MERLCCVLLSDYLIFRCYYITCCNTILGAAEDVPLPVYTPLNLFVDGGDGVADEGGGGTVCAVLIPMQF